MKQELIQYLQNTQKNPAALRQFLLYRGSDEASQLLNWLESSTKSATIHEPLYVPLQGTPHEQARSLIEQCTRCSSVKEKKNSFGDGTNGVMVILHAPRLLDRREIDVYRSESVALLQKMIAATGLDYRHCYITNMIKCEPDDVFVKPSQLLGSCLNLLKEELKILSPKIVIVMGEIQPLQEIVHDSHSVEWFTLEHPITLIKNPDLKRKAWGTLQNVMTSLTGLQES
jgi:uracil-DNA glycosylase family 4